MNSLLKNPEVKSILIKLLVLHIFFVLIIFVFSSYETSQLKRSIVNQNEALVGSILMKHPELEREIIGIVTGKATHQEIEAGRIVLKQYGYTELMSNASEPSLEAFYNSFRLKASGTIFLFLIPLLILILKEYSKAFGKVRKISMAAERVIEGDFSVALPDDREGDFGILGHNFNLMANRLKLSLERLKEDKIFLKNIISDISHQLKTPLTSLVMFNDLMLEDINMGEQLREDFLEKSRSQLNRMEWLILNLLKVARLEAGAIEFKKENIPLMNSVNKMINVLGSKAEAKEQRFIVKGSTEDVRFNGDEEWTAEALINIAKNSIEHTEKGGEITVELSETPLFSSIIIQDDGEGIDKKDLPHIFERFYKGSSTVKTESIGIGLALSKLIVEAQNGSISVYSEKMKGTRFVITFLKGVI
ncbi:HAMP domain-containing histidine kinase [Clostridium swellfunianum]|uniref:HAMP domain-containing sensor histidine kinase n=1 Tax=Clostridium swellfunianum TaxID=1367462 RepID=UPI00202E4499|nr:HAMP domain-containing sensor histidine kinase [Clostridium swellfunianum]MCM0649171.1 HAMP domain-containing histidine kinase [Clostridium swellfunianum]